MDWIYYTKIDRFYIFVGTLFVFFALNFIVTGSAAVTAVKSEVSSVDVSNGRVTFVREPKNVLASIGDSVELPCSALNENGNRVQTTWTLNDERFLDKILSTKQYQTARNGSLIIRNASLQNEGTYRCVVLVLYPYYGILLSASANLTIARIKNFIVEPQDFVAVVGGVARFECAVDAAPSALFTWYHNDLPLKQDVSRFISFDSGILQIVGVSTSDAGSYYCIASNSVGNLTSRSALLTTSKKNPDLSLKIVKAPQNVSTIKGNTALFECLFSGVPAPEVVWKRADGLMPPTARQIGSNLEIKSVEQWFDGAYECTGKLVDKEIQLKANLSVDFRPQIREFPQEIIKRKGETARFTCNTASNPIPEISWFKNGERIIPQGRIKMFPTVGMSPERLVKESGEIEYKRDLVISSFRQDDAAVYQCFAANYLGEVGAAAILVYKEDDGPQDPPENLTATVSQTEKSVELTWDIPASLIPQKITVFIVHFHSNDNGDVENTHAVEANACVNGKCRTLCCGVTTPLKAYTNYTFWVDGLLVHDTGIFTLPSNEIVVTTWDETTTAPAPLMVQELAENGGVRLVWDSLAQHLQRGEVDEYRIDCREGDSSTISALYVPFGVQEKSLHNLKLNEVYYFRVIPKTRAGYPTNLPPNEFIWLKFKIRVITPLSSYSSLSAPSLSMRAINSTAVFVEFKSLTDRIEEYRVVLKKLNGDNDDLTMINETSSKVLLVIGSLEPSTAYQLSVQTLKENGTGLISTRIVHTLKHEGNGPRPPSLPLIPYPNNIVCKHDGSNRVRVSWVQPPPYTATKFVVRYSLTSEDGEPVNVSTVKTKNTTTDSATFTDMLPGRSYLIAVRTIANVGSSKFSDDITCAVPTTVPAAPKGVSSVVLSNNSVLVTWVLGSINDEVSLFRVRFKQTNDDWRVILVNGTTFEVILTDLIPSEIYFVTISAQNNAGISPNSHTFPIVIPITSTTTKIVVIERTSYTEGIVIGVCIAVVCVFVVLVFRARRNNRGWSWHICAWSNSSNNHANGTKPNGHIPNGHCSRDGEKVEMLTLLPPLVENFTSDSKVSKGGNDVSSSRYVNGFSQHVAVNGFHKPLLLQTDPLTVTVESPTNVEQTAEQSSDLSQSAATGSSLQSWSNDCNGVSGCTSSTCATNRRSHNGSTSMPNINLTDSGIGFDDLCNGHCSTHMNSRTPVHFIKNNYNNNNHNYNHIIPTQHSSYGGENSPSPPPPSRTTATRTNGLCYPIKSGNWPKELTMNNHKPTRASTDVSAAPLITNHIDNHSRTISQGTC